MKVVLVSLEQVRGDKAENMRRIAREMESVWACVGSGSDAGAGVGTTSGAPDLVIFPEMTLTGFTMRAAEYGEDVSGLAGMPGGSPEGGAGSRGGSSVDSLKETSVSIDGGAGLSCSPPQDADLPTLEFFSALARKYNTYIAFGLIVKEPDDGTEPAYTNNLVIVDRQGCLVTRYQKIHPFSYSGEDKYYRGGDKIVSFNMSDPATMARCTDGAHAWTIGLSVCYDLRFPELYQGLSRTCNCIINIANWPVARVGHWRTLLQARAIENQCYILGVNRSGIDVRPGKTTDGTAVKIGHPAVEIAASGASVPATDPNRTYEKSSMAIGPLGEILQPQPLTEISDLYVIDADIVAQARTAFPVRLDRKPDIYKNTCL